MRYRIGRFGWKLAYKLGCKLYFRIVIFKSEESNDFCAYSPDIKGLYAADEAYLEVLEAMVEGAKIFVEMDTKDLNITKKSTKLDYVALGTA